MVATATPTRGGLTLKVGDVAQVGRPCMGNAAGARAVVVEIYDLGDGPSPSLLFQNGAHDGFSPRDLELFRVHVVAHDPELSRYQFTTATRLYADWRQGRFAAVWRQ